MVVKDASTHYWTHVNPALVRVLGYTEEELTSQCSFNFLHPDDRKETEKNAQTVATNGSLQNIENRYMTKDGRTLWLSWTAVYEPADNAVYAVAKDVTSIKLRELEVAQQKQELAAAAKLNALGRLAAGIAHEINNPLTIVYTQVHLLRRMITSNSPKQTDLLRITEKIEHMSSRIVKIINGLRSLTRDGSNDPFETVSVHAVLEETLAFCRRNFSSQGIELSVSDVPDNVKVRARPVQISQVLLNLLNNAYDAAIEGHDKWIRVDVRAENKIVEMRVSDSGSGIAPELRSQLFDAFFTTKPVGKGNGLGLNIAQSILSAHGGDIFLDDSAPHTTFVVRLPRFE